MRRSEIVLARILVLVALLLSSGCIAADGTDRRARSEGADADAATWREVANRSGAARGPNVVLTTVASDFIHFNTSEPGETQVDLRARGGSVHAYVFSPTCREIECAHRLGPTEGEATVVWKAYVRETGEWEIHVAKSDPGVAPVDFVVRAFTRPTR